MMDLKVRFAQVHAASSGKVKIWTQPVSLQSLCCEPSCLMRATDNWWQLENNTGAHLPFFLEERVNSSSQWCWKALIHVSPPPRPALWSMPSTHATWTVPIAPWRSIPYIHLPTTYQVSKQMQTSALGLCPPRSPTSFQITSLHHLLQPQGQPFLCSWMC